MSQRTWDFTIFDTSMVAKLAAWENDVNRLRVCLETCPETKKEHLQCRCTFKRSYRFAAVKKLLGDAHIEPTKAAQDDLYCMKLGSELLIDIDNRRQGARTDLEHLKEMVENDAKKLDMFQEHFGTMVRNYRGIYEYRNLLNAKKRRKKPEVIWVYGPSGAGKSTWIDQDAGDDAYWATCEHGDKLWWDGYDQQDCVVLDDFTANMISYHNLLKLLNGCGKFRVPTKGGSDWFLSKKIYISSVNHPRDIYTNCYDYQLERRITNFKEFDECDRCDRSDS